MKIGISGYHGTGKTTLLEELEKSLPQYTGFQEPYYAMEDEGYDFEHPPSEQDFEALLEYSIHQIENCEANTLFDRSPLDYLCYLAVIGAGDEWNGGLEEIVPAMSQLDLLIVVPIEPELAIFTDAFSEYKMPISSLIEEHAFTLNQQLNLPVISVNGALSKRVETVLNWINAQ